MTDDRPSVTDPYLQSLLDAVEEPSCVLIGDRDRVRNLILKAYQQGRNKVIRDLAEQQRDDDRRKARDLTYRFAEIRVELNKLEQDYLRRLAEPKGIPLTAEQMAQVVGKVQEALLNQARKNR